MNALQDLRFALRSLRAHAGTSAFAVVTLALGLGATLAIHAVVSTLLLRDLAFPDAARIVQLQERAADGHLMNLAGPNYRDLAATGVFSASAFHGGGEGPVSQGSRVRRVLTTWTGGAFFDVLATPPERGRSYDADEHQPVAVISHAFWQGMLNGRNDVIGQTIEVDGSPMTVIGVMPRGFDYPAATAVWLPNPDDPGQSRTAHNWTGIARLADGQTLRSAQLAATTLATRLIREHGDDLDLTGFDLTPLAQALAAPVRDALLLLAAGTLFLLLIAVSNAANLLLAQHAARSRELAVRAALGASSRRLARQVLAEAALITLVACVLGLGLAWAAIALLVQRGESALPRATEIGIDAGTLAAACLASLIIAAALSLTVLVVQRRRAPAAALREGGRGQSASRGHLRLRAALLVGQTALTTVLLVGAGLLGRSFLGLLAVDPGFDAAQATTVQLARPFSRDPAVAAETARRYAAIIDALRAIPGVQAVGGVNALPLDGGANGAFWDGSVTDLAKAPKPIGYAEFRVASDGYLKAIGIPLLAGRGFDAGDRADTAQVALISAAAARATWGNADPVGKRIQYGNMDGDEHVLTIVGVVGDVHEQRLDRAPAGAVYVNLAQRPLAAANFNLVLRSALPSERLVPVLREMLDRNASDIPHAIAPLAATRAIALADHSFSLLLLSVFAAVALVLALGGLYGLMSFAIGQRDHELALRQALGASAGRIARSVLGSGLRIGLLGIGLGLTVALVGLRTLGRLLYGIPAHDPWTLFAVATLLLACLLAACALPARRAARIAPSAALG